MTDEPDTDDSEEQPDIEDDEMADISAVAEQVEAEAGAAGDDEDDEEPDNTDEEPDLALNAEEDRTSIGDVYCNVLGMGAAVARDQYGSGLERDRKDVLDEYAETARNLDIDDAVDDWIAEHGGPDSLSPGQTIIVMTVVWGGMVVMDDPAIIENIGGEDAEVDA
jgi:hypothetical protein